MQDNLYRVRALRDVVVEELDPATFAGDGAPRDTADPNDIIHDNTRKAGFAATALYAYASQIGDPYENFHALMSDFLADLHHLADALDVDLKAAIQGGRENYLAEISLCR